MKLENTIYSNHQLILDRNGNPVGVQIDGKVAFRVMDRVRVTGDIHGYICPGIQNPGIGQIVEIRRDSTDHFYGVKMQNGEFGYVKVSRIEHC